MHEGALDEISNSSEFKSTKYPTTPPTHYQLYCKEQDLNAYQEAYGKTAKVLHALNDLNRTVPVCIFSRHPLEMTQLYHDLRDLHIEPAAFLGMDTWPSDNLVDPGFADRHSRQLDRLSDRLEGNYDRHILASILRYRSSGDFSLLHFSRFPEYFHPDVQPSSGDFVIDGGAEGVTSLIFARAVGTKGRVFSFEPSEVARRPLIEKISTSPALSKVVSVFDSALWEKNGSLNFETGYLRSDRVVETRSARPHGKVMETPATTIDSEFENFPVDLIKLDVEGADKEALRGATNTIRRDRPKIMVSLYHQMNDLFEIPELIDSIQPGYKMYLGHHFMNSWETTLYCIHEDKVIGLSRSCRLY